MDNPYDQFVEPPAVPPAEDNPYAQFVAASVPERQTQPPAANPYDQFVQKTPEPIPEPESQVGAGVRKFLHDLPGALGGAAGGALLGGAAGTMGAGLPGTIGGAIVGGIAGGFAGDTAKQAALKMLGHDDSLQMAVNEKAHPITTTLAGAGTAVVGGALGAVPKAARYISAGVGGGFETGRQLAMDDEWDPLKIAATAAGGAIFAKNYAWQDRLAAKGGELGAKIKPQMHGAAGPEANASTAAEPVPVAAKADVGFETPIGEGSEIKYAKPRDSATGDAEGMTVRQLGEPDPTLKAALDAENPPVPPATEPEQGVSRLNAPEALPPQGRPMGEQPTPPPDADQVRADRMWAEEEAKLGRGEPSLLGEPRQPAPEQPTPPRPNDPELSPEYTAAREKSDLAGDEFREAQRAYRAREIGDEEFLAARQRNEAAGKEFDAAYEAEAARLRTPRQDEVYAPGESLPGFPRLPTEAESAAVQPRESHPKLKEAVDRLNANRERLAADEKRTAAGERDIAPDVREGEIIPPIRMPKAPVDEYPDMPDFLRRTPKPPTVAEEPAPAGGREIAPVSDEALNRQAAEDFQREYGGLGRIADERVARGEPAMSPGPREASTGEVLQKVQAAEKTRNSKLKAELDPNTSASDYAQQMVNLRNNKPRPVEKLWRNLDKAPPGAVAEQRQKIRDWNNEYRKVSRLQKMALERDNEAFRARQGEEGLQQDVITRGRSGRPIETERLPIGTEPAIMEASMARAAETGLAPREPETLGARRKGPKPPSEEPPADTAIDAAAAKATAPLTTRGWVTGDDTTLRGQPMPLTATGGGGGVPPGGTAAAPAVPAGVGATAGTPPGGTPPPPPNVGAAAAAGGGGGPATPNMGHTPPQQQSWLKELWRDVQRKTAAHLLGPEGMEARHLIRSSYGPTQRVAEQTAHLLKGHTDMIRAMPDADRWAMINHMQGDNRLPFTPTPEQRTFMGKFERMMQEWEAQLHQLDATEQMKFRKDFMAQMYENPTAAPDMFTGMGKRGSAGSTKHRKHDTYEDAKAAGLIPKTSDPIEIGTRYANSIKDFVASRNLIQRGEATDRIRYYDSAKVVGASGSPEPLVTGGPPPGWKKLDGISKNGKDGYAPDDFADVYNNFMDKGYRGGKDKGNVYDAVRNSTNAWTQLELGINAYHLFTMANEAIIHDVARGLNKVLAGNIKQGFVDIGKSPGAFITRAIEGKKLQAEYLDPNSTNPIAAILAEANARPIGRGHAADYSFQERGSFINKWSSNSIQSELKQAGKEISEDFAKAFGPNASESRILFPLRQAGRVLQTTAGPIFDKYIPMLKAGAVQSQMKDWHEAMTAKNPQFDMINNPADRRVAVDAAMKIVDSVDNRFGEMIHDNMFMNQTLKQSAQVGMRSFSWAIGAIKEIGGGTAATGKALYELGKTGGANNRFQMTNPEWDPRMSYAIAFPFVLATISTVYQYLRAGEGPEGWRDIYAPKTGGTVPGVGGKGMVKEHVLMPGYQKDVLGWIHHPVQEAYNKMGGLPTTIVEQAKGTDWRGDPIVRAGANPMEAAGQRMAHIFSKLSPISVKNMTKGTEPTSNITRVETALGFRAPGAHIQDPEGLKRSMDRRSRNLQKAIDKRERKIQLRQNPQRVSP